MAAPVGVTIGAGRIGLQPSPLPPSFCYYQAIRPRPFSGAVLWPSILTAHQAAVRLSVKPAPPTYYTPRLHRLVRQISPPPSPVYHIRYSASARSLFSRPCPCRLVSSAATRRGLASSCRRRPRRSRSKSMTKSPATATRRPSLRTRSPTPPTAILPLARPSFRPPRPRQTSAPLPRTGRPAARCSMRTPATQ